MSSDSRPDFTKLSIGRGKKSASRQGPFGQPNENQSAFDKEGVTQVLNEPLACWLASPLPCRVEAGHYGKPGWGESTPHPTPAGVRGFRRGEAGADLVSPQELCEVGQLWLGWGWLGLRLRRRGSAWRGGGTDTARVLQMQMVENGSRGV